MPDKQPTNHFALAEAGAEVWLHGDREDVKEGFLEITPPDTASFIMGMALFAIHVKGSDRDAYAFLREVINPHMVRNGNQAYWVPEVTDGTEAEAPQD